MRLIKRRTYSNDYFDETRQRINEVLWAAIVLHSTRTYNRLLIFRTKHHWWTIRISTSVDEFNTTSAFAEARLMWWIKRWNTLKKRRWLFDLWQGWFMIRRHAEICCASPYRFKSSSRTRKLTKKRNGEKFLLAYTSFKLVVVIVIARKRKIKVPYRQKVAAG